MSRVKGESVNKKRKYSSSNQRTKREEEKEEECRFDVLKMNCSPIIEGSDDVLLLLPSNLYEDRILLFRLLHKNTFIDDCPLIKDLDEKDKVVLENYPEICTYKANKANPLIMNVKSLAKKIFDEQDDKDRMINHVYEESFVLETVLDVLFVLASVWLEQKVCTLIDSKNPSDRTVTLGCYRDHYVYSI